MKVDIDKIKSSLRIQLGRWKTDADIDCPVENDQDECQPFIEILISAVVLHNDYSESFDIVDFKKVKTTKNDIALVKLGWSIRYTNNIKPVCFPMNDPLFTKIEVSGFGKNSFVQGVRHYNIK